MAKPNRNYGAGFVTPIRDEIIPLEETKVDSESISVYNNKRKMVSLRSLFDGRLDYTGQETGERYRWEKAGSIISVDERDAIYLLEKRFGKNTCCGNSKDGYALFEKVN